MQQIPAAPVDMSALTTTARLHISSGSDLLIDQQEPLLFRAQTMAMVPGVAVLKALQWGTGLTSIKHSAVQALEQHHDKELAAEQELRDLLGHASHLSPPEMAKAAAANTCRQHQLNQQRDVFIGRVTKLLQVSLTHVLCGVAATFLPIDKHAW